MCDQPCLPILHIGIASELRTPKPTGKEENTEAKGNPAQSTRETTSSTTYGEKGPLEFPQTESSLLFFTRFK